MYLKNVSKIIVNYIRELIEIRGEDMNLPKTIETLLKQIKIVF